MGAFFKDIRQPAWWDGDAYHIHLSRTSPYQAWRSCSRRQIVLTCEIVPPAEDNFPVLDTKLAELSGLVGTVNITDNASAIPRLSAFACAQQALTSGIEPVLQMTTRDRNRLSLQASLIGASAAGIRNLLLVTGDHPIKAIAPFSHMDAWDLDSIQAVWIARKLLDEGCSSMDALWIIHHRIFSAQLRHGFASEPRFQALRAEKKSTQGHNSSRPTSSLTCLVLKLTWRS